MLPIGFCNRLIVRVPRGARHRTWRRGVGLIGGGNDRAPPGTRRRERPGVESAA